MIVIPGLLAIFGSLNALFATASRCPLAMARDGLLPRQIASVNARSGTPIVATVIQAAGAALLVALRSRIKKSS